MSANDQQDRNQINILIADYFHIADMIMCGEAVDRQLLVDCFTTDAVYVFTPPGTRICGADTIAAVLMKAGAMRLKQGKPALAGCNHLTNGPRIVLAGDTAQSDTNVLCVVTPDADSGEGPTLRGLRYRDGLIRVSGRWQICERHHHSLWERQLGLSSPSPLVK